MGELIKGHFGGPNRVPKALKNERGGSVEFNDRLVPGRIWPLYRAMFPETSEPSRPSKPDATGFSLDKAISLMCREMAEYNGPRSGTDELLDCLGKLMNLDPYEQAVAGRILDSMEAPSE